MKRKRSMGIRHTFIGDSGVMETNDFFGFFASILSILTIIGLLFLGVMAYIS